MKKLLFPALIFFCLSGALAQSGVYHPFPTAAGVWRSLHQTSLGTMDYFKYQMQGDTLIGAFSYRKLYSIFGSTFYYHSAIRDDSTARKVYQMTGSGEILLYDFNLAIGDTLPGGIGDTLFVASIDSVQVGPDYHKRFNFTSTEPSAQPAALVEGVGYTSDLFWNYEYTFENMWNLLCFSVNDVHQFPYYGFPPGYSCMMTVGIGELNGNDLQLSVFPNPVHNEMTLSVSCDEDYMIEVIDAGGKALIKRSLSGISSSLIDLSGLNAGIYLVRLSDAQGNSVSRKIVKQQN